MKTAFCKFPAGEVGVRVEFEFDGIYNLEMNFRSSDDIIKLLMQVDAIRRLDKDAKISLHMLYVPYARQDRVMNEGESHSLKVFCDLINRCDFEEVVIADPHSIVTTALLNNVTVISQEYCLTTTISIDSLKKYDFLIAPDAGAMKKIYKTAELCGVEVICATKERDLTTGTIVKTKFYNEDIVKLYEAKRVLVIDDICDGGATFIELAKVIPHVKKDLYVTHGIFSKGKEIIQQYYDDIFCYNYMSI